MVVGSGVGVIIEQFDAVACSGDGSGVVEDGVLSNVEYAPLKDRSYGFSDGTCVSLSTLGRAFGRVRESVDTGWQLDIVLLNRQFLFGHGARTLECSGT